MAEFCKDCSIELFGEDFGDFADLTTEYNTQQEVYISVMCEGCGEYIFVDHTGKRINPKEEK